MKRLLTSASLVLLATTGLLAQTLGEITGEVKDPSGAVIAGAQVTATNTGTNSARATATNDDGIFNFPAMQPGTYSLRVEKPGFKVVSQNQVELQVQQTARFDFTLQVGQTSETVEVSASAAQLNTEDATIGTVIENKRIVELPLNGRNYLSLVALSPNVSVGFSSAGQADSRQGGDRANQNISVAGQRNYFNRFSLDGVENTDPNFNSYVIKPSIDALQEFKVQTGIYPAEFGRGATQINVSTKSGTNLFHGALFEFLRNDKLDAKPYDFTGKRPAKDPFKWNNYGFTLGGPVVLPKIFNGRNKLFFLSNYEWFRRRQSGQGLYSLPSPAERGGDFTAIGQPIFDPNTRVVNADGTVSIQQFPGNVIPQSRFSPVSIKLLQFYPAPNRYAGAIPNDYQVSLSNPLNSDQFTQRFDFVESAKSNWFGRYSRGDENQTSAGLDRAGKTILTKTSQWMGGNTRVLTPSIVNESRFGFTRFYNTTGPQLAFSTDVVGTLGVKGLNSGPPVQWGIPGVGLDPPYSGFGNDSEGPYENNNYAMQFINNTSIVRGKHSLRFGGEIRQDVYRQIGNQFARGQFTFNNSTTANPAIAKSGDSFAGFLLGNVYQAEAAVAIAKADFRALGFALYFDDQWKVTPRMTVSLGLRYENSPPWTNQTGTLFNAIVPADIRPGTAVDRSDPANPNINVKDLSLHPFFERQGAPNANPYQGVSIRWPDIRVVQDGKFGDALVSRDNNDFAPRLGVSWSPRDKWVVRGGVGMFYSQDTGNPRFDMARNLAGRLRDNDKPSRALTWDNALESIAGGVANVFRPYTFANPYDRRTPYSIQYELNVQHEFSENMVVEAGYLGSVSHRLEGLRAVNESVPACRTVNSRPGCASDPLAGLSLQQRSPFPEFGRIQLVDNGGNGNYNGLGAKFTRRFSKGLTFLASYTYSKSIDTSSAIRNQGNDTLFPQNSYCRACERGRSSFDVNQRFVFSGLYDLPAGRGRSFNIENSIANAVLGGWQAGAIWTWQSGFPISMFQSGDPSNTGGLFDRPTSTGANANLPWGDRTTGRWFNTAAFARTIDGTFGNVGRGTLTTAGIFDIDFTLQKNFHFTEQRFLQARFESFNFTNHPNWGNPDINVASSTFGQIFGTRTGMRSIQLGLKLIF